jgi:hypothetical protein
VRIHDVTRRGQNNYSEVTKKLFEASPMSALFTMSLLSYSVIVPLTCWFGQS